MPSWLKYLVFISTLFILTACENPLTNATNDTTSTQKTAEQEKTIRVATSSGPYSDLFFDEIAPLLEKAGYIVEQHGYDQLNEASQALAMGEADLHVEQNALYMKNANSKQETDFVSLTEIPSVPMAIYPANKRSFGEVAPGDRIAIPEEPSGMARGLKLLEEANLLVLDDEADLAALDERAIEENIYDITLQPMNARDIPKKLDELEYAIIPGALMSEHELSFYTALLVEKMTPEVLLQAVVNSEDQHSEWAQLVKTAYNHEEFLEEVEKINEEVGSTRWVIP